MTIARNTYRWAAVATFIAIVLLQVVIFATHGPGWEMTRAASVVPAMLIALWLGAAVGLTLHRNSALPTAVLAAICAMGHGAVLRLGYDPFGFGMLVLGALALVFSCMAHDELYVVRRRHSVA